MIRASGAERRAAPKPARMAMCLRLDAASIAVPSGDRLAYPLDEGLT
jgi:hypothetical protein